MIKQMAWNTFKNTGDLNTFMDLLDLAHLAKNLNKETDYKVNEYGELESKGNNTTRK